MSTLWRRLRYASRMPANRTEVTVARRKLKLSNLDKVLYPSAEFTKGEVIEYYRRVAPVMVRHLKDRPVTLKRYPNGVAEKFFYEKKCPGHRPPWVKTAPLFTKQHGRDVDYCLLNDAAALVWAANLAALELHISLARAPNLQRPSAVVFDLDPGPPADVLDCARIALLLRSTFAQHKLEAWPKTSGSKGLQVYVPLNTDVTYEDTKHFAHTIARMLEAERPDAIVSKPSKELRTGKVFIDWSQNHISKTTVAVYSLRARDRPTASTPVDWDEVETAADECDAGLLVFEGHETAARIDERGDLFGAVLRRKQNLPSL